jgi:hypothetical protein
MEPATGASTWALGSQRCIENIGSLTRKAVNTNKVSKLQAQEKPLKTAFSRKRLIMNVLKERNDCPAHMILKSRGKEAATV